MARDKPGQRPTPQGGSSKSATGATPDLPQRFDPDRGPLQRVNASTPAKELSRHFVSFVVNSSS